MTQKTALLLGYAQEGLAISSLLEQRMADRIQELSALYNITAVTSGETLDLQKTLDRMLSALNCTSGAIHLLDERCRSLCLTAQAGMPRQLVAVLERLGVGKGLVGWVAAQNQPVVNYNVAEDERALTAVRQTSICTYLGVPMRAGGQVIGVFSIFVRTEQTFSIESIALLASVADHIGVAVENRRLFQQNQRQIRELETLYRADAQLYHSLELNEVLQALVDVAVDMGGADKSLLLIWDEERERLVVQAARNFNPATVEDFTYALGEGISGYVAFVGTPVLLNDTQSHPRLARRELIAQEGICSSIHIPIELGEQVLGVFAVAYTSPRVFDKADERLFLAFAQRAARAIENARLHKQAQQTAMLQERQRLAWNLHDSIAQLLYSLTLMTEAGRVAAANKDHVQTSHYLARIGAMGKQVLKETRLLVHELRPPLIEEMGLQGALQQRLEAVEQRAGITTELAFMEPLELAADVAEGLFYVVQEALNNALKHAEATAVSVSLQASDGELVLETTDNGRGFVVANGRLQGGMGLKIMQERVDKLGGCLLIDSVLGQGTEIRVSFKESGAK